MRLHVCASGSAVSTIINFAVQQIRTFLMRSNIRPEILADSRAPHTNLETVFPQASHLRGGVRKRSKFRVSNATPAEIVRAVQTFLRAKDFISLLGCNFKPSDLVDSF